MDLPFSIGYRSGNVLKNVKIVPKMTYGAFILCLSLSERAIVEIGIRERFHEQ